MLKNGIWPYMMGSFFLHVLLLVFLVRAVTLSQAPILAMDIFLTVPSAVPVRAMGQPMHHPAMAATAHRGPETKSSQSGQDQKVPVAATVTEMPADPARKSKHPAFEPPLAAPRPVAAGTELHAASGVMAMSPFPGDSARGPSAATVLRDTGAMVEMSLGDAGAPRFIHREPPVYPFIARKLGKEGKVVLRLTLDERGGQKDIEIVVKDHYGFTEAAVLALKKSILSPAQKDGKPVVSRVLIPVRFVLREY